MNQVVQYYNQIAKGYDEHRFNNTYGEFIDCQERLLLERFLGDNDGIVLDLACGSGRFLNYATLGLDASSEMVNIARKKYPEKEIYIANAETMPFDDHSIDVIISFHFFMHLNLTKLRGILQECERVLKKNGKMIFDIPSGKRRNLFRYKADDWHGACSCTITECQNLILNLFEINRVTGILFLPIHRLPNKIRKFLIRIDLSLANSIFKEYSSYLIIELVKK